MLAPCPSCGLAAWNASPIATIRSAKGRLSIWWPYRASVICPGSRMASRSGEVSGQSFRAATFQASSPSFRHFANPPASGSRRKPPLHSRLRGGVRWAARRPSCWRGGSAVRVQTHRNLQLAKAGSPTARHRQARAGLRHRKPAKAGSARRARRRRNRMGRPGAANADKNRTAVGSAFNPGHRPARLDRDILRAHRIVQHVEEGRAMHTQPEPIAAER